MKSILYTLWLDDRCQDLAEYGMLTVVLSITLALAITAYADKVASLFGVLTGATGGRP